MRPAVLLLEIHRQTLSTLRALAPSFDCVIGLQQHENPNHLADQAFIQHSKLTKKIWMHPTFSRSEEFKNAIFKRMKDNPVDFIFPIGEESLIAIDSIRNSLPLVCAPSSDVIQNCLDKNRSLSLVRAIGIPCPEGKLVESPEQLQNTVAELSFPLILKPTSSDRQLDGEKALILDNSSSLKHLLIDKDSFPLIAQQKVPGLRHNCVFAAKDGEVIEYFECQVRRTDKWNYTGYGVESRAIAPVGRHIDWVKKIASKLNYNGVGCVQFLSDGDSSHFLEINPRLDAIIELPRACGINFPQLAVQIASNESLEPKTPSYPKKRTYWFVGDARGLLTELLHHKISLGQAFRWSFRILISLISLPHHITWSAKDPKPSIYLLSNLVRSIFRKLTK